MRLACPVSRLLRHRYLHFRLTALVAVAIAAAALLPAATVTGQSPGVSNLSLRPDGAFRFDGLDFALVHFNPEWASFTQGSARVDPGYPRREGATWETHGSFAIRGNTAPLSFRQRVTSLDGQSLRADYTVACPDPEGAPTRELALQVTLPLEQVAGRTVMLDGTPHVLPPEFAGKTVLLGEPETKARTLILPSVTGTIEISGVFGLLVQDQRGWKQDAWTVRIRFPLTENRLRQAGLDVTLRHAPWRSTPVSLRAQANRGFHDGVPGDGQGGWTDQGPANDLAAMTPGKLGTAGVTFDIIDPAANDGRASLVLGGPARNGVPRAASIPVPGGPVWRNLYLLHAGAWLPPAGGQPAGTLRIRYADGSGSAHEVRANRDVGNWWLPATLPNGAVGWTGENASCPVVGLYVSRFTLEEKPVAGVELEGADASLWMIAGMSGSPDDLVPFRPAVPLVVAPGPEWAAWEHSVEIEPGGVFDFSFLADAPAGKHGPLVATPAGHFGFADRPGERVRLWGVNLCFSANYLEPDEAERLAARLAVSGYNTVRFHHYDRDLVAKEKRSGDFDPAQLAKLDGLFAAMKRHGLYVNIDLFTLRGFNSDEMAALGIDPGYDIQAQFKALVPISEEAFTDWTKFAACLLSHRNPHTGLTWAEDPALFGICPVNEDTLAAWVNRAPAIRQRYEEAFSAWWEGFSNREKSGGDRDTGFNLFLHERQIASDARMHAFLRSLGVKALLTGTNFHNTQALAFVRERYDYVDNHQYWDHPQFPEKEWALPFGFAQGSALRAAAQTPRGLMPARVWGKPYVVSEFNYVRPNRYRAEGGVLMPAFASLQDWDGVYNFEYASSRASAVAGGVTGTFALADDPVGLMADRVGALLFRRGDIAPAKHAIGYAVQAPGAFGARERDFPAMFSRLGLVVRIGSGTGTPDDELARHGLDAVVVAPDAVYPETAAGSERGGRGREGRIHRADEALVR
ncbi:MAG: hypothetical protein LBK99_24035, partial [Opitutaceae bacterium]|nr:hypothetical protein [Opitutaceae bacterium]